MGKGNDGVVWNLTVDTYLYVEDSVIMTLNKYRQESGMLEAGGCLFGYYRGGHIHVAYCTEPMDGDTRNKFRFDRRDLVVVKY